MTLVDPQLSAALNDSSTATTLLSQLHQQILVCRDQRILSDLLAKYLVAASARQSAMRGTAQPFASRYSQSRMPMESSNYQSISNVMKAAQEKANSMINNMK
jgi:hypothetical protein